MNRHIQSIDREIEFAKNIQDYWIPKTISLEEFGTQLQSWLSPKDRVSGDILDYFFLKKDTIRIFIADACGHGLTAGFQTMSIQTEYQRIKEMILQPECHESMDIKVNIMELPSQFRLAIFTDGIIETLDSNFDIFGEENL